MKQLVYAVALLIAGGCFASCQQKQDAKLTAEARELYKKSISLTRLYTDSISHATDSASAERLYTVFEDKLTKLNFEYPADTDLDMDEGMNDTLIRASKRLVIVRDSILYQLAHRKAPTDSIPADSVASDSIAR